MTQVDPRQSMWCLWWTMCHKNRLLYEYLDYSLSSSSQPYSEVWTIHLPSTLHSPNAGRCYIYRQFVLSRLILVQYIYVAHISGLADANYPARIPCGDSHRIHSWRLHPHHAPYSIQSHVQKHGDTEAGGIPATWFAVQFCGLGHHGTRKSPRYSPVYVILELKIITVK
jgi:hypothetical protein